MSGLLALWGDGVGVSADRPCMRMPTSDERADDRKRAEAAASALFALFRCDPHAQRKRPLISDQTLRKKEAR